MKLTKEISPERLDALRRNPRVASTPDEVEYTESMWKARLRWMISSLELARVARRPLVLISQKTGKARLSKFGERQLRMLNAGFGLVLFRSEEVLTGGGLGWLIKILLPHVKRLSAEPVGKGSIALLVGADGAELSQSEVWGSPGFAVLDALLKEVKRSGVTQLSVNQLAGGRDLDQAGED